MVLLTSGQVSVVITTIIIFLFTSALFLSGYVLQQRTVRDIRRAIKPHVQPPEAKLHLPNQFAQPKPSPKEESVVIQIQKTLPINGENNAPAQDIFTAPIKQKDGKLVDPRLYDLPPEEKTGVQGLVAGEAQKPMSKAERRRRIKEEIMAGSEEEGFKGYKRRMW